MKKTITCGIDIGTTTLSAVVCDVSEGKQIKSYTIEHKSALCGRAEYERIQDADRISGLCLELIDIITKEYDIDSIGFTGQMHGILYTDKNGNACSPLYTWQDGRGNCETEGYTYCERIKDLCGYNVSSGFGMVTHYYNMCNDIVPENAHSFCSIMDYVIMRAAGKRIPMTHPSVAASFGIYDIQNNDFDHSALDVLCINDIYLPEIVSKDSFIGEYKGIPITSALGDNQASVFGSVTDEEKSVLVNYGTGSQVSVITDMNSIDPPLEVRPYIGGKYLICGCALCGGYAYEVLEGFFRSYSKALGIDENQYSVMDELAIRAYHGNKKPLSVSPLFKGTRANGNIRASISGIGTDNFTAEQLILGTAEGMANELYDMYAFSGIKGKNILVASGNGVRKNIVLQKILSDKFGCKLLLLQNKEEAAMGAAMYAALCLGCKTQDIKKCISYN